MRIHYGTVSTEHTSEQLRQLASVEVTEKQSKRLAGYKGCRLSVLFSGEFRNDRYAGILVASDGLVTDPIQMDELVQGLILHTSAINTPMAGLRAWFPPDTAVQQTSCGKVGSVDLKGLDECIISDTVLIHNLQMAAPGLIVEANSINRTELLNIARGLAGFPSATNVCVVRISVAGLVLTVSAPLEADHHKVLVRFSGPLKQVDDVWRELHSLNRRALRSLGLLYQLRQGYLLQSMGCLSVSTGLVLTTLGILAVIAATRLRSR